MEKDRDSIERVVKLLDEWMEDESGYDEETWPELQQALGLEQEEE